MEYRTKDVPKTAEPDCDGLQYQEKDFMTEKQIKPKLHILKQELGKISDHDPKITEAGENLHKMLHRIG